MKITITKTKLVQKDPWDNKFEIFSDFPEIRCVCINEDAGLNFVKGGCLQAIVTWREVPDTIQFVYKNYQEQVPAELIYDPEPKQAWQDYVADDVPGPRVGPAPAICREGTLAITTVDPFLNKFGGVYNYI